MKSTSTTATKFGFKPLTPREQRRANEARAIPRDDRDEHQCDLLFREEVLAVSGGMTREQWRKKFPTSSSFWWLVNGADSEYADHCQHWDAAHARVPMTVLRKAAAKLLMTAAREEVRKLATADRDDLLDCLRVKWEKKGYYYETEDGAA